MREVCSFVWYSWPRRGDRIDRSRGSPVARAISERNVTRESPIFGRSRVSAGIESSGGRFPTDSRSSVPNNGVWIETVGERATVTRRQLAAECPEDAVSSFSK